MSTVGRISISSASTSSPDTPMADTVDRAAAARRDREGAVAQRAPAHHGRADVQPDARRDGAAARGRRVAARAVAWRSSTSRTGSARCGPSPTARSCCATARTPARSARDELTHDNMIGLMVGRQHRRRPRRRPAVQQRRAALQRRRAAHPAVSAACRVVRRRPRRDSRDRRAGRRRAVGNRARRSSGSSRRSPARCSLDGQPLRIRGARRCHPPRESSSCPRIAGSRVWSWTSRFARTCRCRRSAPILAPRARLGAAGAAGGHGRLRSAAGQGAVDRGQGRDLERRQPAEGGARRSGSRSDRRC